MQCVCTRAVPVQTSCPLRASADHRACTRISCSLVLICVWYTGVTIALASSLPSAPSSDAIDYMLYYMLCYMLCYMHRYMHRYVLCYMLCYMHRYMHRYCTCIVTCAGATPKPGGRARELASLDISFQPTSSFKMACGFVAR